MEEKRPIDLFGATALIGFATLLGVNQVVMKITNAGFAPVFQAGLRSLLACLFIAAVMRVRGNALTVPRHVLPWGILAGVFFAAEFLLLFLALDFTSVSRASIFFYTMPVWLGLAAHVLLPGERLNWVRLLGLLCAMGGVVLALSDQSSPGGDILGDLLALAAAFMWAAIGLSVRITPLSEARPHTQLFLQVAVSAPILLALAPLFGALIRDPLPIHYAGIAFQSFLVIGMGFLLWFSLMQIYRASSVASFGFLSPVVAVLLGWLVLGESIGPQVWIALALVAVGLLLINRK